VSPFNADVAAAQAAQAAQLYGGAEFPADIDRVDRFWTDSFFKCPAREIATQVSSHGVPVFQYVFSFDMRTNISYTFRALNDAHGFELPFVFDNWIGSLGLVFGEPLKYARMSKVMSCTWASFIACSKPKCPKSPPNCESILKEVPEWPQFSAPSSRRYLSFKDQLSVEAIKATAKFGQDEFPGDDRCDFWKTVDFGFRNMRKQPESSERDSPSSLEMIV
jgi:carboxylesterase type B